MENRNDITINKISEVLFFVGTTLLAVSTLLSFQSIVNMSNFIDNLVKFFAFLLLLLRFALIKKKLSQWVTYSALILICAYTSITVDRYVLMMVIMTIVGLGDIPIEKFLKKILIVEGIAVAVIASISIILFIAGDRSFITVEGGESIFSFGFGHANVFSAIVFGLISIWVFINFNRLGSFHYVVLALISLLILFAAGTKTIFANVMVLVAMIAIYKLNNRRINKMVKKTAMFIFPVITIIIVFSILNYWQWGIDNLRNTPVLSTLFGRIGLGAYAYERSGWTFLGQRIDYYGAVPLDQLWRRNWFTFDNTYTTMLIQYGIFYIILLSVYLYKLAKKYDYKYYVLIITWALSCLTEGYQLNSYIGTNLLLLSVLLTSQLNSKTKTGEKINGT